MKKIFIFLIVSIIIPSCYWSKPCEEYYIYELTNYHCKIVNAIDGNNIHTAVEYEKIVFDNFYLHIDGDKKFIEETDYCSYMEDSFINYITKIDIYSETDYNQDFQAGRNLNELFMSRFTFNNLVDTFNVKSVETGNFIIKPAITMFLKEKPAFADTFIFDIEIEINDGRTYNFETLPVIITP